jgi:hypothetical protein
MLTELPAAAICIIPKNRAMDRKEHRGRMVTKSPAATAGLIYIYIQPLSRQRDKDYPLLDPECTFFTANPLFSSQQALWN